VVSHDLHGSFGKFCIRIAVHARKSYVGLVRYCRSCDHFGRLGGVQICGNVCRLVLEMES